MVYSLNNHNLGYNFSYDDVKLSLVTCLTGIPYSFRHWELSNQNNCQNPWIHKAIAILEAIPIIGMLAVLVESTVNYFFNNSTSQNFSPLSLDIVNELDLPEKMTTINGKEITIKEVAIEVIQEINRLITKNNNKIVKLNLSPYEDIHSPEDISESLIPYKWAGLTEQRLESLKTMGSSARVTTFFNNIDNIWILSICKMLAEKGHIKSCFYARIESKTFDIEFSYNAIITLSR